MLQLEPSKRISTKGIIAHPYFTNYKKIKVCTKIPFTKIIEGSVKENIIPV